MRKKAKNNPFKKKSSLLALAMVLSLSAVGNIVQLSLHTSLSNANEQDKIALQKYRDLQDQQLESLKRACEQARLDYNDESSYMQTFRTVLSKFSRRPQMLGQYIKDEALANCYAVAFVLRGYQDIYTFNEDRAFEFGGHVYIIKNSAFDEVRW